VSSVPAERTGAGAFVEQLLAAGVEWIFGNPGTTEQAVLDTLQEHDGIDLVVALHEGVAVTAAEGYARASGKVGVVELHAAPGLGNGIGMLYNAFIGQTPLLVYVGNSEQPALYLEPTLSGDLPAMARPVSKWAYEARTVEEIPQVVRRALKVASTPPRGPVVLSVPMDLMEQPCSAPALPLAPVASAVRPDPAALAEAVEVIRHAQAPALVVGDGVAASGAAAQVGELARLIGAPVFGGSMAETAVEAGEPLRAGRLPFEGDATERALADHDTIVAVGTRLFAQLFPVSGLPVGDRAVVHIGMDSWELGKSQPSTVVLGDERATLTELIQRLHAGLDDGTRRSWAARKATVETRLAASRDAAMAADRRRWEASPSPMTPERAVAGLAAAIPADAVVVDESLTAYGVVSRYFDFRVGGWFRGRGGGIGAGMALAVGAQVASPGRRVVAIVGDGSSMYSITALWTAAHHDLPIVWVILDNRSYKILKQNVLRSRRPEHRGRAFVGADLTEPPIDFVSLARGLGVEAERVTEPGEIADAVRRALASDRPTLLDLVVSGELGGR
jgi:benzoylformate decarboxylase